MANFKYTKPIVANFYHKNENTSRYYYCSSCNRIVELKHHVLPQIDAVELIPDGKTPGEVSDQISNPIDILAREEMFKVTCHNCKEKMFPIDYSMINYIYDLRTHGYNTIGCCEGHIDYYGTEYEFVHAPYLYMVNRTGMKNKAVLAEKIFEFNELHSLLSKNIYFAPGFNNSVKLQTVYIGIKGFQDPDEKRKNAKNLPDMKELFILDYLPELIPEMIKWDEQGVFK